MALFTVHLAVLLLGCTPLLLRALLLPPSGVADIGGNSLLGVGGASVENSSSVEDFEFISALVYGAGADQDFENISQSRLNLIFPGTYWCGLGNRAIGEESLGLFEATDSCCRAHDHCPDYIEAGQSKHGLTNTGATIRLLCECDVAFYSCLKSVNSLVSNKLGRIYFNLVGNDCFKEDFPITGCLTYSMLNKRCTQYIHDDTRPVEYQWFNNPYY